MASIALFDLGNVLLDWDPVRLYTELMGSREQAEEFCATVTTMDWHKQHDRGVPMAENARRLIEKHPEHAELIHAWRIDWLDMFDGYVDGVDDIVRALKVAGVPLYALSNMPAEVWPEMREEFPVLTDFRDVIISAKEKMIKPDPRIYAIALERMGNPDPAEVLFIDDRQDNVDAAIAAGMKAVHFTDAAALRAALGEAGLL
ncbi:HAD family hydrolase [Aquisalinus flavus]|uniref:Haloacid dehalogenase n=1 Tax=Aquisalinus flavus TaxID=1526572 RepID=A0A8J2Y6B3_9PROT|nr:HAD family phosphatase [Aquisalinus flavus]GGD07869.1 haloacid dehalogenase [Aquisalinus flavus]